MPDVEGPHAKEPRTAFKLLLPYDTRVKENELAIMATFPTVKCPLCTHRYQPEGVGASMVCRCGANFCLRCNGAFPDDEELNHFCRASIGEDCVNPGCGHLDDPRTCLFNFESEEALQDYVRRPHLEKLTRYILMIIFVEAKKPWDDKKDTGGAWRCQPLAKYAHCKFLWGLVRKFLL